jgi:hypothetical protein
MLSLTKLMIRYLQLTILLQGWDYAIAEDDILMPPPLKLA